MHVEGIASDPKNDRYFFSPKKNLLEEFNKIERKDSLDPLSHGNMAVKRIEPKIPIYSSSELDGQSTVRSDHCRRLLSSRLTPRNRS